MFGFGLLSWGVVLGALAYLFGWIPRDGQDTSNTTGKTALEILKERYARGEVSKSEYEAMRDDLTV